MIWNNMLIVQLYKVTSIYKLGLQSTVVLHIDHQKWSSKPWDFSQPVYNWFELQFDISINRRNSETVIVLVFLVWNKIFVSKADIFITIDCQEKLKI